MVLLGNNTPGLNINSNPNLGNIFKPASGFNPNPNMASSPNFFIKQGSLISFSYQFWVHDPYPVIIVTKSTPGYIIKGININYLTFPFIKNLLRANCNNTGFSWQNVKGDKYIESAFRSYKWNGIRQVKTLDCTFLLDVMATVRANDPNQIQAIKESIREQINRTVNPKAEPTTEQPMNQQPQPISQQTTQPLPNQQSNNQIGPNIESQSDNV